MEQFSGKFNYLVLVLRCMTIFFFTGMLLLFITYVNPFTDLKVTAADEKAIRVFGWALILAMSFLISNYLTRHLINQRFNIIIQGSRLYLQNVFTLRQTYIAIEDIKGYSTTEIKTRFLKFHCLILYQDNGSKQDFPQYLYWNFNQFKSVFKSLGVQYLGHEPYSMTLLGKRKYKYL